MLGTEKPANPAFRSEPSLCLPFTLSAKLRGTQGQAKSVERPHLSARRFLRSSTSTPPSRFPEDGGCSRRSCRAESHPSAALNDRWLRDSMPSPCLVPTAVPPFLNRGDVDILPRIGTWFDTRETDNTIEPHHHHPRPPFPGNHVPAPATLLQSGTIAAAMGAAVAPCARAGTQSFPPAHHFLFRLLDRHMPSPPECNQDLLHTETKTTHTITPDDNNIHMYIDRTTRTRPNLEASTPLRRKCRAEAGLK